MMVFTNTLVTAHSLARRVHEHPLCAAATQPFHAAPGEFATDWKNFYNSKIALFMVSRLKLYGVIDLADDLILVYFFNL